MRMNIIQIYLIIQEISNILSEQEPAIFPPSNSSSDRSTIYPYSNSRRFPNRDRKWEDLQPGSNLPEFN